MEKNIIDLKEYDHNKQAGRKNPFYKQPGVYKIENQSSKEIYIGSTGNISVRISGHLSKLRNNNHPNEKLQDAYNKNPNVNIFVKTTTNISDAIKLEQELVNINKSSVSLCNKAIEDVTRVTGVNHSEETKAKIAASRVGAPLAEETKEKIRQANIGKKYSDEVKKKLSLLRTGHLTSEETRKKISISNTGKTVSEESRKKISTANSKPVEYNGVVYSSFVEAANFNNVSTTTIRNRVNKLRETK